MKIHNDAGVAMDADASVDVTGSFATVTFESRGPGRNIEYIPAFELVFRRLAKIKATLHDALVVSRETKLLQESERRAKPGFDYPIALTDESEAVELAASIRSATARIGRAPDMKGGGNPTKRITIQVSIPDLAAQPSGWLQHCLLFPTEPPPTEVIETTVRSRARSGRQGYGLDAAARKVIEDHAMSRAASYFTALGATVEDVSRTACYDLKCIDSE